MWIFTCIIFNFVFIYHISYGEVAISGRCYAHAQMQCEHDLGHLWAAVVDNDRRSVCQHLENFQTCLEGAMENCGFQKHELELYQGDIVKTYTKPPYSCTLRPGKMTIRSGIHQGSSGTTPRCTAIYPLPLLHLLLFLVWM